MRDDRIKDQSELFRGTLWSHLRHRSRYLIFAVGLSVLLLHYPIEQWFNSCRDGAPLSELWLGLQGGAMIFILWVDAHGLSRARALDQQPAYTLLLMMDLLLIACPWAAAMELTRIGCSA